MTIMLPGDPEPDSVGKYPVYTRTGWPIPQQQPDRVDQRLIKIRAKELSDWGKNLILRSLSTYPYNCVGMVFASRRAWIDPKHVYRILNEDGYRKISLDEVKQGDVVLYKYQINDDEPTHVALVVWINPIGSLSSIQVISKWGKDAEFLHFMENVPDRLGKPMEFWTDRR